MTTADLAARSVRAPRTGTGHALALRQGPWLTPLAPVGLAVAGWATTEALTFGDATSLLWSVDGAVTWLAAGICFVAGAVAGWRALVGATALFVVLWLQAWTLLARLDAQPGTDGVAELVFAVPVICGTLAAVLAVVGMIVAGRREDASR